MMSGGTGVNDGRQDARWVRPTVLHSPLDPTRARPEPWFVGSGRGLMILVVSLCAVLLVLRGVTMIWMAEEAWAWLQAPRFQPPREAGSPVRSLPTPPQAPLDVDARPVTMVLGNPGQAFSRDAYPLDALRKGDEGRVVARMAIDIDGRATGCTIVTSSGSSSLDRTTCAIGAAKLRYRPLRDGSGRRRSARYDLAVRWTLED